LIEIDVQKEQIDTERGAESSGFEFLSPLSVFRWYFWIPKSEYTYAYAQIMGSGFIMRMARIAWSLVSGKNVLAAGRDWILDPVEPRFGFDIFVALVTGGNISNRGLANDHFDLGHVGLGGLSPAN